MQYVVGKIRYISVKRLPQASYQCFPSHHAGTAELTGAAVPAQGYLAAPCCRGTAQTGARPAPLQGLFCSLSSSPHRPLQHPDVTPQGQWHSKRQQQGSAQLWGPFQQRLSRTTQILKQCSQLVPHSLCLAVQRLRAAVRTRTQGTLMEGTTTTASALEKHSLSTSQQLPILYCSTVSLRGSSDTGTSPVVLSAECASICTHPAISPGNYRNT